MYLNGKVILNNPLESKFLMYAMYTKLTKAHKNNKNRNRNIPNTVNSDLLEIKNIEKNIATRMYNDHIIINGNVFKNTLKGVKVISGNISLFSLLKAL